MDPYISLPRVPIVGPRQDFLVQQLRGRRVLHIGCVDSGLLEQRLARGQLLHARLAAGCAYLSGVDVDAEGIAHLRQLGFGDLTVGDVTDPATLNNLGGIEVDVVLVSEVIEHLDNPGLFLDALADLARRTGAEIVVTVPNAFRVATLLQLLRGVEHVNPDHNYWFSFHTIHRLLSKHGFEISETFVYSFEDTSLLPTSLRRSRREPPIGTPDPSPAEPSPSAVSRLTGYALSLPRRVLVRVLYRRSPFWGDGLILRARVTG